MGKGKVVKKIKKTAKKVGKAATDVAGDVLGTAGSAIKDVAGAAKDVGSDLNPLDNTVRDIGDMLTRPIKKAAEKSVGKLAENSRGQVRKLGKTIGDATGAALESQKETFIDWKELEDATKLRRQRYLGRTLGKAQGTGSGGLTGANSAFRTLTGE